MTKRSWLLFALCLVVFFGLRLLSFKKGSEEGNEKVRPVIPEPVLVKHDLLCRPWVLAQPKVTTPNIEMVRDLSTLDELCEAVKKERPDFTHEQIELALIKTLTSLQSQIPFELPEELYNVLCICETPLEWIKPPIPFHVYKRLYLGEMEVGLPFYLDVRVFELEGFPAEDLITWHLETLEGEPELLHQSEQRVVYKVFGDRTREIAHGFAKGERGLYLDCIEEDGKLFVLYAEAPVQTFKEQESLFKQLLQKASYNE